ncbi:MAG: hypothetical protein L3J05_04955, partial [Robiginitomaculum sp.]|nr:hypothetical protein [Robiginitomaculum sp.]
IQETARPDLNVKKGSEYRPEDGLKDYLTLYHIPTGIGRDYLYVGLRGSEDNCCTISALNINIKYGESYKMKEYKPKKKTNE